jgi:Flp pilus assembly protein TadG
MLFARFWQNRDGGVAPFLALAAVPLMGFTGAAIDYSRASAARTAMQVALDATALNLSKTAQGKNGDQIQTQTQQTFNALFVRPEVQDVSVNGVLSSPQDGNFKLVITGTGTVKTLFSKLIGHPEVTFSAKSEVLWGIKKLNLALALDNTGSMASAGKMTALKTAAHNLLNTLKAAEKQTGDIKVSIIPFAVDVNVGTDKVTATWIDWEDWEARNGTCTKSYNSKSNCESNSGIWTPKDHSVWNGCVNDRDQNNDVTNTPTGTGASTKYRAHQASACPAAMMALSTEWTTMHTKVDEMQPSGNTNVTIGLQMAWQTLSNNEPFNAPPAAADLDKVIILLTDGQNTQNRWSQSTSTIDARTEKACDNVKAANIKLYTVRVIDGNATLLKNCATKADMYYDVDQADELNGVFSSIAQNLANLRIAK